MGLLKLENIHHAFKRKFVEVEAVAHVVVRRHGLRIIVYHHRAPALLLDGHKRVHRAPVELYRRTDAVSSRTKHDDRAVVARIVDVISGAVIGQIEIVRFCRILGRKCVDLLHNGSDAARYAMASNIHDSTFGITVHFLLEYRARNLEVAETLLLGQTQKRVG